MSDFEPVQYTSFPIRTLNLGFKSRFAFRDAKLILRSQQLVDEFEKVLADLREVNPALASKVRKIDHAGAERLAAEFLGKAVVGTRTSGSLEMAESVAKAKQVIDPNLPEKSAAQVPNGSVKL